MAYMSYCRFEGTRSELRACMYDVEEHINEEADDEVSEREVGHFESMVEEFYDWMTEFGLIDAWGELDREKLSEVCDKMRKSYGGEEYEA